MSNLVTLFQAASTEPTKVYATESVARAQATKRKGVNHRPVKVAGGWMVKVQSILTVGRKTNVIGRCSGGNWLNQSLKYIETQVDIKNIQAVEMVPDEHRFHVVVNGTRVFWTRKPARAQAIAAALA